MKKIIIAIAFIMGAGVSSSAMAAAVTPWQSGNLDIVPADDCVMLAENVTLGVSTNVWGHFTCDEATGAIKVGTCHKGGSRKGVACAWVDDDNDALTAPTLNAAGCTADLADAGSQSPIPSYSAFTASSAGGSMVGRALDGRCESGTLSGLDFWN